MMSNVKYDRFQEMVDRALLLESKHRKMEDKKRKFSSSQQQLVAVAPATTTNRVPNPTLLIKLVTRDNSRINATITTTRCSVLPTKCPISLLPTMLRGEAMLTLHLLAMPTSSME
jgi:hypothetical protein